MDHETQFERLLSEARSGQLSRRVLLKRATALGLSAPAIAALLAACGSSSKSTPSSAASSGSSGSTTATSAASASTATSAGSAATSTTASSQSTPSGGTAGKDPFTGGKKGGTLRIASIGDPATLDEHQTTAGITAEIGYCWFETLFAYDDQYQPSPMLAESFNVSADGLTQTIKLRQGVPFHNGEEMKSADVVASLTRWAGISGVGKKMWVQVDGITAPDDYTVEIKFKKPYGTTLIAFSNNTQAPAIYPKSIIDKTGDGELKDFIGTGPYKLTERAPDKYIRFERFADYKARDGGAVGSYAGHKYQYVDKIEFVPVPDESARVAGMQAGDYHISMNTGNDQYDVLKGDSNLRVEILPPSNWDVFFCNWKSPLMSQLKIRQAFQACIDELPIMQSSRGGGDFVKLDPSFMMKPTAWYTTVGEEYYNQKDPEKSKKLLQEAGYDGTPVRFMCTQEYSYMYGAAIVAKQQMEAGGFTVDLQVTDWATVLQRRAKPEEWDIFVTGHGFVPDPSQISYVGQMNIYPGWWSSEASLKLADELLSETDFDKRFALWKQIQMNMYTEIPAVKTGDSSNITVWSKKVGGYTTQLQRGVPYWNIWLT